MGNIVKAIVGKNGKDIKTAPLYQYDYGQILKIEGITLPTTYQVHFSNDPTGTSTTSVGNADGVEIPDVYLTSGDSVYAWLYLHTGEDDGETVLKIEIPVRRRAEITNQTPTPQQQSEIDQLIGELNAAVDAAEDAQDAAEDAAEQAEAQVEKYPVIVDGYWAFWDEADEQYVKSNQKAQGPQGEPGDPGDPTELIDDTSTGLDKVWSASKSGQLLSALTSLNTNAVQYVGSRTFHVGENLLTSETAFSGTGWSGSLASGFTHATGNTDPLVFSAETVNGQAYIIDYDFTGDIGGDNMFVAIGDMPKVDVYHGAIRPFVGIISDGGYLKIYCKSTYTGTITNLKIRPVLESGGTELTFECAEITNGQNPKEISSWHVVAIGRDVLSKNVNGTRTVAIGDRALEKIVTGHRNIAIGPYAMPFVTEGDCNVSIGADTLYNPSYNTGESKAYSNVAIGKGTMLNGELVQNNIAIGHGAMSANDINAEENVCIGRQAGYNTKKRNTFIGHKAGYYYNGDAGINNVCIGTEAGHSPYHNGQNNVYIGAEARAQVAGASASTPKICNNSIAIGKGARVDGSYQIVIGNANYTTVKIAGKTIKFNEDGTVTWE